MTDTPPTSWWHNPHRASLHHYSLDGRVAACHREFNSEWEPGDDPGRRCHTCARLIHRIGDAPWGS